MGEGITWHVHGPGLHCAGLRERPTSDGLPSPSRAVHTEWLAPLYTPPLVNAAAVALKGFRPRAPGQALLNMWQVVHSCFGEGHSGRAAKLKGAPGAWGGPIS